MTPYIIRQRLAKLDAQIALKKEDIADLQRELVVMFKRRERLVDMLDSKKEVSVTDHAILRHLEREQGVDIEKLRNELKDTEEIIKRGTTPVVVDNTLITVVK